MIILVASRLAHMGVVIASVTDSKRETCHGVERRRRLGYLDKIEFTDSIAGVESLSWQAGYCLLGVRDREFGGYFRMLSVKIRKTVCEQGKFDEIRWSDRPCWVVG